MAKETKSARVKVQYLNKPFEGKINWSIKTPDGTKYGVRPALVAILKEGGEYDIKYVEGEYQGRPFKTIESATAVAASAPSTDGGATATKAPATFYKPESSPDEAERIFVAGALNALLSNPTFPAAAVNAHTYIGIVKNLRQAWKETFGGKPSAATEMDDYVPEV